MNIDNKILSVTLSNTGFGILLVGFVMVNLGYNKKLGTIIIGFANLILTLWGLLCFDPIEGLSVYLFSFIFACLNFHGAKNMKFDIISG